MSARQMIDSVTCSGCGLCVAVCPAQLLTLDGGQGEGVAGVRADRLSHCMGCGHCMAICPTESITVEGLSYGEHLFELGADGLDGDTFERWLASRRSIRVFKETPVPRAMLERIVEIVSLAPMGYPPHKVEITVIPDRETIELALPLMVELYGRLQQGMATPIGRFFIRRRLEPEALRALDEHVLPTLEYRLPEMRAGQADTLTWGAPALLLFHADRKAGNHSEDALIALTYALLAAHVLGLGATAIGLVPQAVERSPALRKMFLIPAENEVLASAIVGYPKYRFRRGIRRELAGVHWIDGA